MTLFGMPTKDDVGHSYPGMSAHDFVNKGFERPRGTVNHDFAGRCCPDKRVQKEVVMYTILKGF